MFPELQQFYIASEDELGHQSKVSCVCVCARLCVARDQTQDPVHARQVTPLPSYSPSFL